MPITNVIVQPGYATGDLFGIAATLIIDPAFGVVITKQRNGGDPTEKADSIEEFYKDVLPPSEHGRISKVVLTSIRSRDATDTQTINDAVGNLIGNSAKGTVKKAYKGVGEGTNFIQRNWAPTHRTTIRARFKVDNSIMTTQMDKNVAEWLRDRGTPTSGKRLVILWSRFSGKKGDVHLEHDTGFKAMKEMVEIALEANEYVIITGDKPLGLHQQKKFDDIVVQTSSKRVFNLTSFWEQKTMRLAAWCAGHRIEQFKLYEYFERNFGSVRHLGFRSGNLEAMALLGYDLRYMEEPGSRGGDRMAKWANIVPYKRLLVEEPVTRSGKYLKTRLVGNYKDDVARPDWAPVPRATNGVAKPPDINAFAKGLSSNDKLAIGAYLNDDTKGMGALDFSFQDAIVTANAPDTHSILLQVILARCELSRLFSLDPVANVEDFEGSFKIFSKHNHPDKTTDETKHEKFRRAKEALDVLRGNYASDAPTLGIEYYE